MDQKKLLAVAVSAALSTSSLVFAGSVVNGPMAFDPIAGSAELTDDPNLLNHEPWVIPEGYTQQVISDESRLDVYPAMSDWNDMNTVNETGKHAGHYLYRTHEVRPGADLGAFYGGAVSVVDLRNGETNIVVQRQDWEALDGIVWTPWQTLLVAEETGSARLTDPDFPAAVRGLAYEIRLDPQDPTAARSVEVRPMLGSIAHEGIEVDAEGNVYVIDEYAAGAIYKFVPETYGDLSSGQLYALKVDDSLSGDRTGEAEWVALDMGLAQIDARQAAVNVGATTYGRPEDLERIANTLYVAVTSENRVLSVSLGEAPTVRNFVQAGMNVPAEAPGVTGLAKVDNLANGPDGKLWIVEDNVPSDIWVAEPDVDGDGYADGVHLFASLRDRRAEGTGIYFGREPHTLYVNVQHSVTGNDKTMAITNRKGE